MAFFLLWKIKMKMNQNVPSQSYSIEFYVPILLNDAANSATLSELGNHKINDRF